MTAYNLHMLPLLSTVFQKYFAEMKAVILLIVYAVTLVRGSSCPPGWEPYAGTSDRCIAAFRNESSWFDSLRNCQRYGASLVSIHNSFQNLHVASKWHFLLNFFIAEFFSAWFFSITDFFHRLFRKYHYHFLYVAALAEKTFESCKYWIGLYNIDADKKFRWTDNSQTDYSNWLQGSFSSEKATKHQFFLTKLIF